MKIDILMRNNIFIQEMNTTKKNRKSIFRTAQYRIYSNIIKIEKDISWKICIRFYV